MQRSAGLGHMQHVKYNAHRGTDQTEHTAYETMHARQLEGGGCAVGHWAWGASVLWACRASACADRSPERRRGYRANGAAHKHAVPASASTDGRESPPARIAAALWCRKHLAPSSSSAAAVGPQRVLKGTKGVLTGPYLLDCTHGYRTATASEGATVVGGHTGVHAGDVVVLILDASVRAHAVGDALSG